MATMLPSGRGAMMGEARPGAWWRLRGPAATRAAAPMGSAAEGSAAGAY